MPTQDHDRIRQLLSTVVKPEVIDGWLQKHNDAFGCRPVELIGTERQSELEAVIHHLALGEPSS